LRDGGVTLNENILMRLFSKASIEKEAIHRVAFDAGNIFHVKFFLGKIKATNMEHFSECFKKIAAVVESKPQS
jgi:hypothetical protein